MAFLLSRLIYSYLKKQKSLNLSILLIPLIQIALLCYIAVIGGDNPSAFPFWRHHINFIAVEALIVGYAIHIIFPRRLLLQLVFTLALLIFANFRIIQIENSRMVSDFKKGIGVWPNFKIDPPNSYYTWIKKISLPQTVIASAASGELPYVVDAIHIDILGLNDKYIAHNGTFDPQGPVDSKTNMAYVLKRRPDIISMLSARLIAGGMDKNRLAAYRGQMIHGLLDDPVFQNEYMFLQNGPYEFLDRALFLHKSYWLNHPRRDSLKCIPLNETGIYK